MPADLFAKMPDERLHRIIAQSNWEDFRKEARAELKYRVARKLRRLLVNQTGTCGCGRKVYLDDNGAYSSGYWLHADDHKPCMSYELVVADPNDSRREAAGKALASIRNL